MLESFPHVSKWKPAKEVAVCTTWVLPNWISLSAAGHTSNGNSLTTLWQHQLILSQESEWTITASSTVTNSVRRLMNSAKFIAEVRTCSAVDEVIEQESHLWLSRHLGDHAADQLIWLQQLCSHALPAQPVHQVVGNLHTLAEGSRTSRLYWLRLMHVHLRSPRLV